jgi:hypothetical protein
MHARFAFPIFYMNPENRCCAIGLRQLILLSKVAHAAIESAQEIEATRPEVPQGQHKRMQSVLASKVNCLMHLCLGNWGV